MVARVDIHRTPEAAIVAPHRYVHHNSLGSGRMPVEAAGTIAGSRSMAAGCMSRVRGRLASVLLPTRCRGRARSPSFVVCVRRCSWEVSVLHFRDSVDWVYSREEEEQQQSAEDDYAKDHPSGPRIPSTVAASIGVVAVGAPCHDVSVCTSGEERVTGE